ncbi:hypothetical protein G7Z17_g650 [Cylindrodendrum hubeiense]|uniref:Uncharacterized protein n=1 Tax=Cylindrodendrum hubeiense TaxID=595255 RepID=A0A9P5LM20_9HYPO|nr:hypothetical protein G7Z17_g650 [Cylindrodendrum hubeiense]
MGPDLFYSTVQCEGLPPLASFKLTVFGNEQIVITYTSKCGGQSDLFTGTSGDGILWEDNQQLHFDGSVSALENCSGKLVVVWTPIENQDSANNGNGQLNISRLNVPLGSDQRPPIERPTQGDLWGVSLQKLADQFYLDIHQDGWKGQPLGQAPLYYATTHDLEKAEVTIHYIFLYAYQNGQTVRRAGGICYDAVINDIGSHQGDLERFAVTLAEPGYEFVTATFEAHGRELYYDNPCTVNWVEGTHAVVSIGLGGHGMWNRHPNAIADNPHCSRPGYHLNVKVSNLSEVNVSLVDFTGEKGIMQWRTWEVSQFRRIGLDDAGRPIGAEIWASFPGRIGDSYYASLFEATCLDGSNLDRVYKTDTFAIFTNTKVLQALPRDKLKLQGTDGPGKRSWIFSGKKR